MFGEFGPKLPGSGSQRLNAVPPGVMLPWFQADAALLVPAGWALCNGGTAVWQTGPRAGKTFTTPNMIGMFLEGADILGGASAANASGYTKPTAQTAAGATTVSVSGTASVSGTTSGPSSTVLVTAGAGPYYSVPVTAHTHTVSSSGSSSGTGAFTPASISFPWIIKL